MRIVEKYSHLNGEEFLLVHQKQLHKEIMDTIRSIDANLVKTKVSKEKTMKGRLLYNPDALNKEFKRKFKQNKWQDVRYQYYVTTDFNLSQKLAVLPYQEQGEYLASRGIKNAIRSYKQTDFVKDNVAVEVQFGKYSFVAYDLFVKHLLFYSGGVINLGVEVLPMKAMQSVMSTGIAYYEGEVHNVLRYGRNNPPVPLLIIGVEP